jgi:hypothetical protein
MKRKQIYIIVAVSILLSVGVAPRSGFQAMAAQVKEPTNVRDYFLLVPERYIGYDRSFREELLREKVAGTVVDVKNGYISYKASDNPETFEFTIFKKADGKNLVAFSVAYDPDFPDTTSKLLLLSYENGRWADVTRAMLPVRFDKRLTYKLPREGTNINVTDDKGRKMYRLVWTKSKFMVSER